MRHTGVHYSITITSHLLGKHSSFDDDAPHQILLLSCDSRQDIRSPLLDHNNITSVGQAFNI
jgi:hypothetical protein